MTLKEHIDDIRRSLEKGEFPPNEAAVCDDIVRRLVHELGWPRYQSQIVYPQYPVEGGKVDFALCHPPLGWNKGLLVTMPNGEKINHKVSAITFAEVIEKLEVERVRNLNKVYIIPIISTSKHHTYNQHKSGRYYIMTHSDTKTKKKLLEEIASELGESLLKVEIVEKS